MANKWKIQVGLGIPTLQQPGEVTAQLDEPTIRRPVDVQAATQRREQAKVLEPEHAPWTQGEPLGFEYRTAGLEGQRPMMVPPSGPTEVADSTPVVIPEMRRPQVMREAPSRPAPHIEPPRVPGQAGHFFQRAAESSIVKAAPDDDFWAHAHEPAATSDFWAHAHEPDMEPPSMTERVTGAAMVLAPYGFPLPTPGNISRAGKVLRGEFDPKAQESADSVRSALQGATLGHAGQILEAGGEPGAEAQYQEAAAQHPGANLAGGLATGFSLPGIGGLMRGRGAAGVIARILANAGIGGGIGAASRDTGMSLPERTGWGMFGGGAGGVIGELAGALGAKGAAKVRKAEADVAAKQWAENSKAMRSARSALGGESAAAMNEWRHANEVANAPANGPFTLDQIKAAQARIQDPEFHAVVRNAAQNMLDQGPERLAGSLQTARNIHDTARFNMQPNVVAEMAANRPEMLNPIRTQILPRAKTMATRAIPIALGTALEGPVGALAGTATAMVHGAPGTAAANAMKNPGMRKLMGQTMQRMALPGKAIDGRTAGIISRWLAAQQATSPNPAGIQQDAVSGVTQ